MANSPFKGPEFRALFQKWNQILEAEGHQEIENFSLPDAPLKAWHNLKWQRIAPECAGEIHKYYEKANELLKTYSFVSETHRLIWELHCEGASVRKIAAVIHRKKFTKTTVNVIILRIERTSGIRNG